MKRAYFICLLQFLTATFLWSQTNPVPLINPGARVVPPGTVSPVSASQADPKAQAKILDQYGKLPLSFEANHGQADGRVKFLSRTGGYTLFLTGDEAVLALRAGKTKNNFPVETRLAASPAEAKSGAIPDRATGAVLRMKLRNANPAAKITGTDELAGTSNYFIGNDPTKWRTSVPTYAKVKYEGIYSGIDLVYYGNQRQLEYDFIVAPGADPRRIAFDISGAKRIWRDADGDLVLKMATGENEIRWHKPVVYQENNGTRQEIAARYAIENTNRVGFEVAKYDASRPLYIDPLIYSTYLGDGDSQGLHIAVDSAGNAYVTGYTFSNAFPTTAGAFQRTCGNNNCFHADAFVAKINPAGSALVYSTYLGGSSSDLANGIAVDGTGNAYVTGQTNSTDFPTMNPLQPANGGTFDAFVAKINPAGSGLVYSTYLGGSAQDVGSGVAVDSAGNAYITGGTGSANFPTMNPLQPASGGGGDAFVTKINPSGSALVYSTYLGGSTVDSGTDIAVDNAGNIYVSGFTQSTDFPTMNPLQPTLGGQYDAFVAKINPTGSALVYSTYLGGSQEDFGNGIAVDSAGNAYVTGVTQSTDFPMMNPLQSANGGSVDAFVAKINPAGSGLVYSTYLGGSAQDAGSGIAVDIAGNAYVIGDTNSHNFPTESLLQKRGGLSDAFMSKLNAAGSALLYSTYLGGSGDDAGFGIAVDSAGNAYGTGFTQSPNFPTTPGAFQTTKGLGAGAFVTKIVYAPTTTQLTSSVNPSVSGKPVTFTATVSSSSGGAPTGKVSFRNGANVLGTATLNNGTARFTTSQLPPGLNRITAVYRGDSNFESSTSAPVNQFVLMATTTTLTSSPNPSTHGQAVTFTATVASSGGAPPNGETVTFKKGTVVLGTGSLSGGSASFTTSSLPMGTNSITAVYGGDSNFAGSKSNVVKQVVN